MQEIKETITNAGYSADRLVDSKGEHFPKYSGRYHAVCLEHPPCNPNRMGALTDKIHSIDGFITLADLIDFINKTFPNHKAENHPTKWIIPLDKKLLENRF